MVDLIPDYAMPIILFNGDLLPINRAQEIAGH
jgi:hypothetical protein